MSAELLDRLRERHAFDPTPMPEDLGVLHVPFDELCQTEQTEAALRRAAQACERVALVGPSGSGKSSVATYVFGSATGEFAPLQIPVAAEADQVVRNPGPFAQHALRALTLYAERVEMLDPGQREELLRAATDRHVLPSRSRKLGGVIGVGLPWLAKAELATEMQRELATSQDGTRSAAEQLDTLARAIQLIRTFDLTPVLVIDDSDRWLNTADGAPREDVVADFFGRVVRELTALDIGLTVAVHSRYLELPAYRNSAGAGLLNTVISIPALETPDQLAAILRHRMELAVSGESLEAIFPATAIEELWAFYTSPAAAHSVRKTLQIAHMALAEASRNAHDDIGPEPIRAAVASTL